MLLRSFCGLPLLIAVAGCGTLDNMGGPSDVESRSQCESLITDYDKNIEAAERAYEKASKDAGQDATPEKQALVRQATAELAGAVADQAALMGACKAAGFKE